jgi:hypothetical protein
MGVYVDESMEEGDGKGAANGSGKGAANGSGKGAANGSGKGATRGSGSKKSHTQSLGEVEKGKKGEDGEEKEEKEDKEEDDDGVPDEVRANGFLAVEAAAEVRSYIHWNARWQEKEPKKP